MSGWAIQQALYSALSGASAVTDLCGTIVDFGPRAEDASGIFPYIAFGQFILGEWDTDRKDGFDVAVRIHTYSNAGGAKECRQIQDAIYSTLHRQAVAVTGYDDVLIYREDSQILQTTSGAFHGVCEYRALLRKTT